MPEQDKDTESLIGIGDDRKRERGESLFYKAATREK